MPLDEILVGEDGSIYRQATITMRSPSLLDKWWYRSIGMRVPSVVGGTGDHRKARAVPYFNREFHRRYANANRLFWLPCILCDQPFGGHEAGKDIPNPIKGEGRYIAICSACSRGWHHDPFDDE